MCCALSAASAWADEPATRPSAVSVQLVTRSDPNERIWVTTVDLTDPRVSLCVARGGDDPDGAGPWQTTLMKPSEIAKREGFEFAVNGDFFMAEKAKDAEGVLAQSQYQVGKPAATVGCAVTDGVVWSKGKAAWPSLTVDGEGKVDIRQLTAITAKTVRQAISGNSAIVWNGKVVSTQAGGMRHPRTAVGLDQKRTKLFVVVVDGRSLDSFGMNELELAAEMVKEGCFVALNLDGGGSTVLVRKQGEGYAVLNHPSDGVERPVANVLGVRISEGKGR